MDLEPIINKAKITSRLIVESGMEHKLIMLAITPEGASLVIITGDTSIYKPAITELLQQLKAYAYILVGEGTASRLPEAVKDIVEGKKEITDLPPEDRFESLLLIAVENGKSFRSWNAKIDYDRDGNRHLGEWKEILSSPAGAVVIKNW